MSNNKQSSVEWLYIELDKFLKGYSKYKTAESILKKAKAMHREEIETAWTDGAYNADSVKEPEQYYNKTFGEQ